MRSALILGYDAFPFQGKESGGLWQSFFGPDSGVEIQVLDCAEAGVQLRDEVVELGRVGNGSLDVAFEPIALERQSKDHQRVLEGGA